MLRHQGGERVKAGFYLNATTWEVTTLSGDGGTLTGTASDRYLRVPALGLLVFAPLMGALYAIFLPFIGIAMVLHHLAKRTAAGATELAHAVMGAVSPAWRPGEAHFTGEPDKDGKTAAREADAAGEARPQVEDRLARIEDEIARRERK
jgi:hypothetical protein